jgi:acetoin utilization protein AcuC
MASVIYHPAYRRYSFGDHHPFSPRRLDMLRDLIEALGYPDEEVEPDQAVREDILDVHADYYVRRVEQLSAGEVVADSQDYGLGTPDTPAFGGMDDAARWIVGGTLTAARLICSGEKRVLQLGGGLHHAQRNYASGFCVYNDLAIAIDHLTRHGLWVTYLDIDVHHGDGVQQILYEDKRVMTISLHESGQFLFPGSGAVHELGAGLGRGLKLNVPLEPFTGGDSYLEVFDRVVPPAIEHFRPAVLVVQAGADAHFDDPLADLMLTTRDYEAIFRRVLRLADDFTAGRVLFTLGGGYSFNATPRVWAILHLLVHGRSVERDIPESWRERWKVFAGGRLPATLHDAEGHSEIPRREEIAHRNRQVAERLLEYAAQYWF